MATKVMTEGQVVQDMKALEAEYTELERSLSHDMAKYDVLVISGNKVAALQLRAQIKAKSDRWEELQAIFFPEPEDPDSDFVDLED